MKLRYSPTSPYARKVMVVAKETGLDGTIQIVETKLGPDSDITQQNPLGKVPTMVLDDGSAIFDSPVICEYVDSQSKGARMFPPAGPARWKALMMQALADGLMDASLARRGEMMRPADKQSADALNKQASVMARVLDTLEKRVAELDGPVTIGHVTVGCALGYLDLRFADDQWRKGRPKLAAWYEAFAKRPSMVASAPPT
jgi:glutathione S-transferase